MMTPIVLLVALVSAVPHEEFVLKPGAPVWDFAAQDVTGDGMAELFVLCCDTKSRPLNKFVAVYEADETGGYLAEPTSKIALKPEQSTLFFAEVDGAAPPELVTVDAEGAVVLAYRNGRFEEIAAPRFRSLYPSGVREPVFLKDVAVDLDRDGIDEWLSPAPMGYDLRNADGLIASLSCDVVSDIYSYHEGIRITHRLPDFTVFETSEDAVKGLAFLSDEAADFAYGPGWAERRRFVVPLNVDEKWDADTKMADINGDKFPDLVVTQTKGTINLKAVTHVYLASAPFTYPEKPTKTFEADGAVSSPALLDVDGDGDLDVVLLKIPFGVRNIITLFLRRKVSVKVEVYLFNDGTFDEKPSYVERLSLDAPDGRERIAYSFGDFSGDGRIDVAYGRGANRLVIHTSDTERLVSAKPWVTLSLPSFGVARPCDLNGNSAQDLVIYHPGGEHKERVEVVVF
ncbi:MAG: hypothetical protein GWP08_10930 [Nitrospiraceae bacterium]|nr:hypothetical protein [Nitrospiraceae bacterium]